MPAPTTANTKTVTVDQGPHITAAILTTLLAKPIELLTVAELGLIQDALHRVPAGGTPGALIGAILT